ncbi:hypothetical protein BH24GEM1_BH24GEM1_20550 [soil metagenome]
MDLWSLIVLPAGLGLLGFIEPCTMGTNLLFIQYLERMDRIARVRQALVFTASRATFMGLLGAGAGFLGTYAYSAQRWLWGLLATAYLAVGLLYLVGRQSTLLRSIGPHPTLATDPGNGGATRTAVLGVIFGLNVPACATPLVAALLAASVGLGSVARGFVALAVFGLALSAPLVLATAWPPARHRLDRLVSLSRQAPSWTGVVFLLLGGWSLFIAATS